jgi:hypothetical protein
MWLFLIEYLLLLKFSLAEKFISLSDSSDKLYILGKDSNNYPNVDSLSKRDLFLAYIYLPFDSLDSKYLCCERVDDNINAVNAKK